jgi:Lantibiotic modifying enzyme
LISLDSLCCGNLGQIDALVTAGGPLLEDARRLVGKCLGRREQEGALSLAGHAPPVVNPLFFNGISGAAYTLLRLRNPDTLPSVLLLD